MTDIYWNYDINPLSDRAQFYLNTLKSDRFSGHPVRDLVEIIFECYGFLSEILENYRPSGEDSEDAIVVALSSLFAHWPPEKLTEIRNTMKQSTTKTEIDRPLSHKTRRDSDARKSISSFMSASSKMLSGMKLGFRNRAPSRSSDKSPENTPTSSPARMRPTEKEKPELTPDPKPPTPKPSISNSHSTSSNDSQASQPSAPASVSQSVSTGSRTTPKEVSATDEVEIIPDENPEENLPVPTYKEKIASSPINSGSISPSNGGISTKNQEYFKKMREDEQQAKRTKEEEESKLTPQELKKIEDDKKQQVMHDANKTAHLSKLGSNFIVKKEGRVMGDGGGRGGRGRGGGRN